jgi:VanZ family protein
LHRLIGGFWRRAAVAFVPAMIFAAVDEFHQTFVPSRTGSVYDVLVDYSGAFLGILICRVLHLVLTRRGRATG